MRPTLWLEVKRVLGEALERPAAERDAFVGDRCDDAEMRAEVLRLLRARERVAAATRGDAATEPHPPRDASPPAAPPADDVAGAVVAGRYELDAGPPLGAGAFGTVRRARDRVTGDAVAVKILLLTGDAERRAMRREVAVLQRARLPGLVELLDERVEHGRAYLVMRLAEGDPFPGRRAPVAWTELAPRALALVEALGRLHWLGLLHRDLKPDNVLVDAAGRVTIVDLGVAGGRAALDTSVGYLVGTPAYLAPERLAGAPATVATDLYAVGVLLYEALSGRLPRDAASVRELIERRADDAPPLAQAAPTVPRHVAAAVDALLLVDAARRPRSARVVAALLRGEGEQGAALRLPWIGDDAAVRAVVDAVRDRRPLDLAGAPGAGRTRTLDEAERRLVAEGRRVLRTRRGDAPFSSLEPVVGALPEDPPDDLPDRLRRSLRAWLGAHVAVFADDWDALDAASRDLLESVRSSGAVVRVVDGRRDGALVPSPRAEHELRALFQGPDRIFHLREDGARELFRRTAGRPGDVVREIETWVEAGIARWEDGHVVLDRAGIERLETRLSLTLPHAHVGAEAMPPRTGEAAALLEIAGCALPPSAVAAALGRPPAALDADVAPLLALGTVRRDADGNLVAVQSTDAAAAWSPERRRRAHAEVAEALPPGSERRLLHLTLADRLDEVPREALRTAERLHAEGRHHRAVEVVREGLAAAARGADPASASEPLFDLLTQATVSLATASAFSLALSEFPPDAQGRTELHRRTCLAAQLAFSGDTDRAAELLASLHASDDAAVVERAFMVENYAARIRGDRNALPPILRRAARWARSRPTPTARVLFASWLGWLRYAQERFGEAAALHARAARRGASGVRAQGLLDASSAYLEAGDLRSAERHALAAAAFFEDARLPRAEARLEWLLRSVAYRGGRIQPPDTELAAAAAALRHPHLTPLLELTEAAHAFRTGHGGIAVDLALRAAASAEATGRASLAVLARALAAACGASAEAPRALAAIREHGGRMPAAIREQAIALVAPHLLASFPGESDIESAAEGPGDSTGGAACREILSHEESRARLRSR